MSDNGGATIGGVAFSDLGLLLLAADIPLYPDIRQTDDVLPGYHGEIDLNTEYGPRPIGLKVMMLATDETDFQIKLQWIAKVFNPLAGVKSLILDRMTGKRWLVKYNGKVPIEKLASLGNFTLPFKASYPFSESVADTSEPLEYGQGYTYGMSFRIGDEYSFPVTDSPTTFAVFHAGTHEAYPVITLTGEGANITITNTTTGEACTLNLTMEAGDMVEVNCAPLEQTVTKNGTDAVAFHSGKFPKLVEGENSFTITATGPNMTVAFIFRHTYLY